MPKIDLSKLDPENRAGVEELLNQLDDARTVIKDLTDVVEGGDDDTDLEYDEEELDKSEDFDIEEEYEDDDEDDLEKIMKSNPAVRAAFEAQREELAKAQKRADDAFTIAKAERDRRELEDSISKVKKDYNSLNLDADKFGQVVKAARQKLSGAEWDAIDKALTAANEAVSQSSIFKTFGSDNFGAPAGGAEEKLDTLAKSLAASANISYSEAYDRVILDNAELYSEFVKGA